MLVVMTSSLKFPFLAFKRLLLQKRKKKKDAERDFRGKLVPGTLTKAKQLCGLNIVGLIFHLIFHRRRPPLFLEDTHQGSQHSGECPNS